MIDKIEKENTELKARIKELEEQTAAMAIERDKILLENEKLKDELQADKYTYECYETVKDDMDALRAENAKIKDNIELLKKAVFVNKDVGKLTYADIEQMVKPLEWKEVECEDLEASVFFMTFRIHEIFLGSELFLLASNGESQFCTKCDDIEEAKDCAQQWLTEFVAAALGVEREERNE